MEQQTYYQKNREQILKNVQRYSHEHPEGRRKRHHRKGDKNAAYLAYGGYICRQCGEKRKECLTIDHINNDGAKHRQKIGNKIYEWLKANNYPSGFQILCFNCNISKYRKTKQ